MTVECFVLAGGSSRRFGEDKLLYTLGGETVIEHTLKPLKVLCKRLCLVAKDTGKFSFLKGVELLKDSIEKQYALAGLYTALENMKGERALILAGDMPLVKEQVVRLLLHKAEAPLTLFRIGGKLYPLFAVYYRQVLPELRVYLQTGGERLVEFVSRLPFKELSEKDVLEYDPQLLSFINMNTRAEAELIIRAYGKEGL